MLDSKQAVFGLVTVITLALLAILAPVITTHSPTKINLTQTFQPPSLEYPMGTDDLGRDVLTRIIYGGRTSLLAAVISVGISLLFGVPLGVISGYYRGAIDSFIMRFMDALMAFPGLILAIALAATLGPGLTNAMIAIGIVGLPGMVRLTRGQVLQLREMEYVQAARVIGAGDIRIMFLHVLPNGVAPLIIAASLGSGRRHSDRSGVELHWPGRCASHAKLGWDAQ